MDKNAKIYIAGHRGLVGSAILENLKRKGFTTIITRTHKELDLANQLDVATFFSDEKPEYVFLENVPGVRTNTIKAECPEDNVERTCWEYLNYIASENNYLLLHKIISPISSFLTQAWEPLCRQNIF